jgi:hypothetical protein
LTPDCQATALNSSIISYRSLERLSTAIFSTPIKDTMQIRGIKRGNTIELLQDVDLPDGVEIVYLYCFNEKSPVSRI